MLWENMPRSKHKKREENLLCACSAPSSTQGLWSEGWKTLLERALLTQVMQESGDKTRVRLWYTLLWAYKHRLAHCTEKTIYTPFKCQEHLLLFQIHSRHSRVLLRPHGQNHVRGDGSKQGKAKWLPQVKKQQRYPKRPKYICAHRWELKRLSTPPATVTQGCPGVTAGQPFLALVTLG